MEIIQRIAEGLLGDGFVPVNGLCPSRLNGELKIIGLQKRSGMVLNVSVIIDTDKIKNYDSLFADIIKQLSKLDSRVSIIGLFCTNSVDERLNVFCSVDTDIYADKNDIRWIVDNGGKRLVVNGNQPNEVLNIHKIVNNALSAKGELAPTDISTVKAKVEEEYRTQHIKVNKCLLTYSLIGINIVLYLLSLLIPEMSDNMAVSYEKTVLGGEWYRLVTYMLMHGGIMHLAANSLSLYIIGSRAERAYGRGDYAVIYLITGVCGGFASILGNGIGICSVGASAAICGLLGAVISYSAIKRTSLGGLDLATLIVFALVSVCGGALMANVDSFGHIGGFVGGIAMGAVLSLLSDREKTQ